MEYGVRVLQVDLINFQGLTNSKAVELERIFFGEEGDGCMRGELRVVGLVETHKSTKG